MLHDLQQPVLVVAGQGLEEELLEIARSLEGQLTASVHCSEADLIEYADLIAILETKVGRLIFNGFSTGVEVCPAMVHGGPYPATSDSRSTAVGSRAITRFARLVCFQNFPDAALPDELKEANPRTIWRMTDGEFENLIWLPMAEAGAHGLHSMTKIVVEEAAAFLTLSPEAREVTPAPFFFEDTGGWRRGELARRRD